MLDALLLITLIVCLVTDLKYRRIYNKILMPALFIGIVLNVLASGIDGLWLSTQGFLSGLGLLLIPFVFGGIGGGDVKLLATIGAIKGPQFVLYNFIYMGLAGGVIAIIILIYKGSLKEVILRLLRSFWVMIISRFKVISLEVNNEVYAFPYGLAIAIGALGAFINI